MEIQMKENKANAILQSNYEKKWKCKRQIWRNFIVGLTENGLIKTIYVRAFLSQLLSPSPSQIKVFYKNDWFDDKVIR